MSGVKAPLNFQRSDFRDRLYNRDFDSAAAITALISRGEDLTKLEEIRSRLGDYRDNAVLELRKNAFKYHNIIINTAKEMQQLEKSLSDLKGALGEERTSLASAVEPVQDTCSIKEGKKYQINSSLDGIISRYRREDETDHGEESDIEQWFKEAAADIEDHFEMRRFRLSVELLTESKRYFLSLTDPNMMAQAESFYKLILEAEEGVIERLLQALKGAMDCPFGGDRSLCLQLVDYLKSLDRSYEAGVTFLDNRSRLITSSVAGIKAEGSPPSYIKRRSECFFGRLSKTVTDFDEFGFYGFYCKTALTGWVRFHLNGFISQHIDHIFSGRISSSAAADCIWSIRTSSQMMTDVGMDVSALLDTCLDADCNKFLNLQVDRFIELISTEFQENDIQPIVFESKDELGAFLKLFSASGLGMAVSFVDGLRLNVAEYFIEFARLYLQLVRDILNISSLSMEQSVGQWMRGAIDAAVKCLHSAANKPADGRVNGHALIGTIEMFIRNLIANCEDLYRERFAGSSQPLTSVKDDLTRLHSLVKNRVKVFLTTK